MRIDKILALVSALLFVCVLSAGCSDSDSYSSGGVPLSGKPDPDFASNGTFLFQGGTPGARAYDLGSSLATDSRGRIVVAGGGAASTGDTFRTMIWRLTPDGALDPSFNGSGFVTVGQAAGGNGNAIGYAAATDAEDRVVVAGVSVGSSGHFAMTIWRYTAAGALDPSFNGAGFVTASNTTGGELTDQAHAVALDAEGRIVAAGYSTSPGGRVMLAVWRYDADGRLDPSFDGKGFSTLKNPLGGPHEKALALAIDGNGRILVAGYATNIARRSVMVLRRLKPDGTNDTDFHSSGPVTTQGFVTSGAPGGPMRSAKGLGVAVDQRGRVVVAGYGGEGNGRDLVVWRYNPDGTSDTTFGGTGFVATRGADTSQEAGLSVAIDASGRIVVAGGAQNPEGTAVDAALWRFLDDGRLDASFNGNGIVHHGVSADLPLGAAGSVKLDRSGRILVAGVGASQANGAAMFVSRFFP